MIALSARELETLRGHAAGKPIKPARHRTSDKLLARGLLDLKAVPVEGGGYMIRFAVSPHGFEALKAHSPSEYSEAAHR